MKKDYLTKSFLFFLVLSIILFYISISLFAFDLDFGGQFNASLTGFYDHEYGYGYLPQANLDLELFIPPWDDNEVRIAGYLYTDMAQKKIDFFWKKLYWKHRFDNFHLTIGRQPISWSFGSLLNPLDYSLGAVALDEDYNSKYHDAIDIYYPINWNTSLSLVASISGNFDNLKIGLRGRTLINDFDVTVHYIQENEMQGKPERQQFGITAKGDIGKYGVYGASGFYIYPNKGSSFSLLAGIDYSYYFQAGNRLYLQGEYLNIPREILPLITGSMMSDENEDDDKNIHLLVGNISYSIDDFSSISIAAFDNISDGTVLFMPNYSNQINTNTSFKLQTGITLKTTGKHILNLSEKTFLVPTQFFVEAGIEYTF